jgi:glycosyltransferase involved in cell wall biosynthesis
MRILWFSPAPWFESGYGQATLALVPRLQARGHEVVIFSPAGLQGGRVVWRGMEIWPTKRMPYGTDALVGYAQEYQPDVVVTLYDEWVLGQWQDILGTCYFPWVIVHYEPMEPLLYDAVKHTWRQLALCNWGAKMMKDKGLDPRVVTLGVDTNAYRPLIGYMDAVGQVIERDKIKPSLGCPEDKFLVGMVGANIDFRKHFEAQVRVFRDFNAKYKDSHLFVKTNITRDAGGWDMLQMVNKHFDLSPTNTTAPVSFPAADSADDLPVHTLALWYNAFDVYLNCAQSEGFGLTIAEANACGCPAIVTDCSAMSEVAYGWKIPGTKELNVLYSYGTRVDEQKLWNALEEAYKLRGTPQYEQMRREAREHAMQYDWNVVAETLNKELESFVQEKPL